MNSSEDFVIVLAEDDHGHARLIEKNLRAMTAGLLVRFENGKDALDYLRSGEQASLLLLDLNMPVMDGYQVLRRLKADPRTMRIPVIVLTTTDDPIERCYDLGCTACVVKSADCSQLNDTMRRLDLLPERCTGTLAPCDRPAAPYLTAAAGTWAAAGNLRTEALRLR